MRALPFEYIQLLLKSQNFALKSWPFRKQTEKM